MAAKYISIPAVPTVGGPMALFLAALRQNVQLLTGAIGGPQPSQLACYPVINLPANVPGLTAFATDGRKVGEAAGKGSGVMVFSDNTAWYAVDSGTIVTR